MLTEEELNTYLTSNNLTDAAKNYIRETRSSDPYRGVGQHTDGNVCSWFYSKKLGHLVSSESSTAEFYFILESEYSSDVYEYWEQPKPIEIRRLTSRGHRIRTRYTPDFLVIKKSEVEVIEIKSKNKLEKLVNRNNTDWQVNENGYVDGAAYKAFKNIGLTHRVISSDTFNHIYFANLKLLLKSRSTPKDINEEEKIINSIGNISWITLEDLKLKLKLNSIDSIVSLIEKGVIYGQLHSKLLTATKSFTVSASEELIKIYEEEFEKNLLSAYNNESISIEKIPSKSAIEEACRRLELIKSGTNNSSVRRWKKSIKDGLKEGRSALLSLTPKIHLRGNRTSKISEESEEILLSFIKNKFATSRKPSVSTSFLEYEIHIEDNFPHVYPVSLTTFKKYINNYSTKTVVKKREGKRAYNSIKAPTPVSERKLKSQQPFEYAGIDHYLAKIELIIFNKNGIKETARPWITCIFDDYTKSEIGTCISFAHPSRNSIALALRDCVRRFNKVPDEIIADRGAEFRSRYMLELSAHLGFSFSLRPSGDSRFGGLTERHFGEFTSFAFDQLDGSFKKNVYSRSTSRSHSAKTLATLEITEFYELFIKFLDWRQHRPIHNSFETSHSILTDSSKISGLSGIPVNNDISFQIATAVEAKHYLIDPARGIQLDGVHYWSPALHSIKGRKKVEVRIEPQNPYIVYALINSQWHVCEASQLNAFNSLSIPEQLSKAATIRELRKQIGNVRKEANKKAIRMFNEHSSEQSFQLPITPNPSNSLFDAAEDDTSNPLELSEWSSSNE